MTRIFDALRKARSHGPPPAAPPIPVPPPRASGPYGTPAALGSAGLAARARADLPLPAFASLRNPPPMGGDVLREVGTLRLHLEAALAERVPRRVMVVGAQGREGTTTVAAQLALAVARDGRARVLLVDAHARRAALSVEAAEPGPDAKEAKRSRAETDMDREAVSRVLVLPLPEEFRGPGGIPAQAMRQLLDSAEPVFDWIIVDGPPVLESPDAAPLSALVDGVVLVVQAGRTKRPVIARSVELLRKAGARVLGTVLNRRRLEIPGFIYRRI
jgi:Mrp family chromosome partitioning ATPase